MPLMDVGQQAIPRSWSVAGFGSRTSPESQRVRKSKRKDVGQRNRRWIPETEPQPLTGILNALSRLLVCGEVGLFEEFSSPNCHRAECVEGRRISDIN